MSTIEVWIVMDEDGNCEVATDEDIAIDRWKDEFEEGVCRVVKLNVTMSEPLDPDDDNQGAETDKPVDVVVPDDAGRIVEIE